MSALREYAESAVGGTHVRRRLFAGDTAQGIALIDIVRTLFDVVLMNPPFGAGTGMDIRPFARFVAERVEWSLERAA